MLVGLESLMSVGVEDVGGLAGFGAAVSGFSPPVGCCEDRLDSPVVGDDGGTTVGGGIRGGLH